MRIYNHRLKLKSVLLIFLTFVVLAYTTGCSQQPKIAQWRGTDRLGIYEETELLNKWPDEGPELLWVYKGIGRGYATPSVTENRIFVNGEIDSTSYVFAFDLDGNLIWKTTNGKEFVGSGYSSTYPGSRSTPTVVDNLVYTTSGMGKLTCLKTDSGNEVWSVDLVNDLGGLESMFGYSESVAVDETKVYCFPGGNKNNTVALDRFNGEIIWSSAAMKDTFSYCSPAFVELPSRKILLTHSRHNLYVQDCENGSALASYGIEDFKYDGEHCNTPVYDNGSIYFIGNEKKVGAVKLQLSPDGEKLTEVWRKPKIKNNFNGFIRTGDKLYTTVKGNWLKALNTENGAVTDSVKVATGSLILADNKFICYGMNGEVNLISNVENKLAVQSTFEVQDGTGHHFSHPVVKSGVLYIRHGDAIMAYKIK